MTGAGQGRHGGLFAGTAWYYARYRPAYPSVVIDDVVQRLRLDGTGRLLDLGCGSGQLTVPLARYVAEAVGVDPEGDMLIEAARHAQAAEVTNITWVKGSSEDLPGELGRFRLVTMGRSFPWMDRDQVLGALAGMVEDDGGLVIANDGCLVRPTTAWQQVVEEVQHRFLGPVTEPPGEHAAAAGEPHELILARSAFRYVDRHVYEFERPWTVDHIIGYLYSTSVPIRRLLGERRSHFERAIAAALRKVDPGGWFIEPVALEVLMARKES